MEQLCLQFTHKFTHYTPNVGSEQFQIIQKSLRLTCLFPVEGLAAGYKVLRL